MALEIKHEEIWKYLKELKKYQFFIQHECPNIDILQLMWDGKEKQIINEIINKKISEDEMET